MMFPGDTYKPNFHFQTFPYMLNPMHGHYSSYPRGIPRQEQPALTEDELIEMIDGIDRGLIDPSIQLSRRSVKNNQLVRIINAISSKQTAEKTPSQFTLDFSLNDITDAGIHEIISPLKNCKTITKLNLSYNEITDIGAKSLLLVLEENYTILELDLSSIHVSTDMKKSIQDLLNRNKRIREIFDQEKEKYDYYLEFLLVSMSLGLPKDIKTILLESCIEVPSEALPFLKELYSKLLSEAEQLYKIFTEFQAYNNNKSSSQQSLTSRLRSLQKKLTDSDVSGIAKQEDPIQHDQMLQFSKSPDQLEPPNIGDNTINAQKKNNCCILL